MTHGYGDELVVYFTGTLRESFRPAEQQVQRRVTSFVDWSYAGTACQKTRNNGQRWFIVVDGVVQGRLALAIFPVGVCAVLEKIRSHLNMALAAGDVQRRHAFLFIRVVNVRLSFQQLTQDFLKENRIVIIRCGCSVRRGDDSTI